MTVTSSHRVLRRPAISNRPMQLGEPGQPTSQVLRMIEEASDLAFQQGMEAGRAAAEAALEARVPKLRSELAAAIDEQMGRLRADIAALAPEILDLAMSIAEVVIGRNTADAETLLARVTRVLEEMDDDTVVLLVSPSDRSFFAEATPQLRVAEDPALAPGEARLEGAWASADLTYATLLEAVRRAYDS